MYARPFFDLQLELAQTVSTLSGLPLARALLDYTNLYVRFGLGRDFDPAHPGWLAYLAGLRDTDDRREWTYRFYLARAHPLAGPAVVARFGCFSYACLDRDRLRLHFQNAETDGHSPLAEDRRGRRGGDLASLFAHVKHNQPAAVRVVGASWLYNLDAYRRLFPEKYLATAHVVHRRFRYMPLWGQFLDRHGQVRENSAKQLRERLGRQTSLEDLDQCFPFQVLALEAPASDFYDFYDV